MITVICNHGSSEAIGVLQHCKEPLSSLPIGFHLVVCDLNKIPDILRAHHDLLSVPQQHLQPNRTLNRDDDSLVGAGDAKLPETAGYCKRHLGDDEWLESEDKLGGNGLALS